MSEPSATETTGSTGRVRRSFGERLWGALRLRADVYEEVEHDPDSLGQAALVIGLAAIAEAIAGSVIFGASVALPMIVSAFLGWVLMTAIVWLIGVRVLEHTSDYLELLRTLGFASAPRMLTVLGVIVPFAWFYFVLGIAITVLVVIAFVVAARQALDVETGQAVMICILAAIAYWLLGALLTSLAS